MNQNSEWRQERDGLGVVNVPRSAYWGAQTQRALGNFAIGEERMPAAVIHAMAVIKASAAEVNVAFGRLERGLGEAIARAAEEVAAGGLADQFPLAVWQSGSGTQSHMNVNEVIASRANELLGAGRGSKAKVHANDHVNLGQSSNDVFPSAMHIAAALMAQDTLLPSLRHLHQALAAKAEEFAAIVKLGRTHGQDATPITLGQEFSGYGEQVKRAIARIEAAMPAIHELALGGTAVGTGLNSVDGFDRAIAARLAARTGLDLVSAANKFEALAASDAVVALSAALSGLGAALAKIANDIRLLGSGPRAGLGELILPDNEPGSSIMPGKVNPTQCEALIMIAARVFGNHTTVTFAGAGGVLELNAARPVMIDALLQSIRLLADGARAFADRCIAGIRPDRERIARNVESSLMLATALAPHIGYDRAAEIARKAHVEGTTLRAAALALGYVAAADFDAWVRPEAMTRPAPADDHKS